MRTYPSRSRQSSVFPAKVWLLRLREVNSFLPLALWGLLLASGTLAPPAAAQAELAIELTRVATGLARPIFATSPQGDDRRLFIAEQQTGRIRILDLETGLVNATPFLDLSGLSTGDEQGLLGLAFSPNYQTDGQFYVNFTESSGRTNIRRYTVSGDRDVADTLSAETIMRFSQPQANHNGGWIGFGPNDGYLYVGSGDGGGANDSGGGHTSVIGNAQDITNNLLGKMLRIDVEGDDFPADNQRNYAIPSDNPFVGISGDDEIWAYGLRNPWRPSFDRQTGDLYIADVGQNAREEINFQPAASTGGENYGWRLREGTIATPSGGVGGPAPAGAIDPIHQYSRTGAPDGGFSVTGGYVYRGPVTALQGQYFFADFVSDQIWSFRYDGQNKTEFVNLTRDLNTDVGSISNVSSFGEDNAGNLYIISLGGDVFRIDSAVESQRLVAAGSDWRYLDDGSNQGTAWRAADFDDSVWKEGPAQLGYGDGDEQTVVDCGPSADCRSNNQITTYFRRAFDVADASLVDSLSLGLLRDDGAAVYLNGVEIARTDSLAPGADFQTLANLASAVGGSAEDTFFPFDIDPARLQAGENVLAVEIHQSSPTSSDISFDLQLSITNINPTVGDANLDGSVDRADLRRLVSGLGMTSLSQWTDGNFSGDNRVSLLDAALLQIHFGTTGPAPILAAVPEPSAWLLGCAGAILLLTTRHGTRCARNSGNHVGRSFF